MSIFKACDLRGVVGLEWDESDAERIGRSLGAMLCRRNESQICVGGDFRRSTPALKTALTRGLQAAGVDVMDVGQGPTPMVYFAARHLGLSNAAVVTASHNPGPYNGVKMLIAGRPAITEAIDELQAGLDAPAATDEPGAVREPAIIAEYESWLPVKAAEFLAPCPDQNAGTVRVVTDAMTGAASGLLPRALRTDGFSVEAIRDEIDADFSACDPDPSKDRNLAPLADRVRSSGADLGLALDGDADRVIFVDDLGRIVRPEQIASLLASYCLSKPVVIYDLKCASTFARTIRAEGGRAVMRPSGHGFIKTAMLEENADLGVEVSGHHFFGGDMHGADDGLLTALILCRLVRQVGQPLSELIRAFPLPAITPDLRIRYDEDAFAAIEQIAAHCGGRLNRLDGVRAEYETGWALARASITEPAITVRIEGSDWTQVRQIAARFLAAIPTLQAQVLEMIDG